MIDFVSDHSSQRERKTWKKKTLFLSQRVIHTALLVSAITKIYSKKQSFAVFFGIWSKTIFLLKLRAVDIGEYPIPDRLRYFFYLWRVSAVARKFKILSRTSEQHGQIRSFNYKRSISSRGQLWWTLFSVKWMLSNDTCVLYQSNF